MPSPTKTRRTYLSSPDPFPPSSVVASQEKSVSPIVQNTLFGPKGTSETIVGPLASNFIPLSGLEVLEFPTVSVATRATEYTVPDTSQIDERFTVILCTQAVRSVGLAIFHVFVLLTFPLVLVKSIRVDPPP